MSDFSDSDFDDEEFVALTLRPPRNETQNTGLQTSDKTEQGGKKKDMDEVLLAANGEIAILRLKIQEIEKSGKLEKEQILSGNQKTVSLLESKIEALKAAVDRLEDERKFLHAEVRNSNRKKRKTDLSNDQDVDMNDPNASQTETSVHSMTINLPAETTQSAEYTAHNPIRFVPPLADDNAMLIDSIMRHSITGLKKTTMEFLGKIALTQDFVYEEKKFTIPSEEPIAIHILEFLNRFKNVLRLDQLLTVLAQLLIQLINVILEHKNDKLILPVPFLLALLQEILIFRPNAVTKEMASFVLSFNIRTVIHFGSVLKPQEIMDELHERHEKIRIKTIQSQLLQQLSFLFSLEIMETVLINLSHFKDYEFNKKLVGQHEQKLSSLIQLLLSTNSCINLVFVVVTIINCLFQTYEDDISKFPLLNQVVFDSLLKLIQTGIPTKKGWFITGLNRIIGNDQDNVSIPKLIDWNIKINKYPKVIHPIEAYNEVDILNKHEFHSTNLSFQILMIVEKFLLLPKHSPELQIKDPIFLRSVVFAMARNQQLNLIRQKSNLSYLRSKYISKLIRIFSLHWDLSNRANSNNQFGSKPDDLIVTSPTLPKEITHMLMIILARVAFSNNSTSEASINFLYKVRSIKSLRKTPIFNKFTEMKAREIGHINTINDDQGSNIHEMAILKDLVDAEIGVSNGVEFAYDDDVIELAREIIEKFTTMEEADALYTAMCEAALEDQ